MNLGGQKRTIETPCGFIMKGHPQEINKKHARHRRVCQTCISLRKDEPVTVLPNFCKLSGEANGWNGVKNTADTREMKVTAVIDGVNFNFNVTSNNVEGATKQAKVIATINQII